MQNICSEFFCKIDAEIKNIENNFDNPIDQSKHLVTYLEDKLKELFSWLENHTFSSEENEIYFFKKLKYRLTSKYIYNHKIIEIESSAPSTNKKLKIKYYKEVIRNCHLESIKDKEFYKYYRSGYSHYDHLYFTRNSAIQTLNKHITTIYLDIRKCSLYDYKVAIINANDMLTEYCEKKINQLNNVVTLSDTISNLNCSG